MGAKQSQMSLQSQTSQTSCIFLWQKKSPAAPHFFYSLDGSRV